MTVREGEFRERQRKRKQKKQDERLYYREEKWRQIRKVASNKLRETKMAKHSKKPLD